MTLERIVKQTELDKNIVHTSYSYDFAMKEILKTIEQEQYITKDKKSIRNLVKEVSLRFAGAYSTLKKEVLPKLKKENEITIRNQSDENKILTAITTEYVIQKTLEEYNPEGKTKKINFKEKTFQYTIERFKEIKNLVKKNTSDNNPVEGMRTLLENYFSGMQKQSLKGLSEKTQNYLSKEIHIQLGDIEIKELSTLKQFPLQKIIEEEIQVQKQLPKDRFSLDLSTIEPPQEVRYEDVQGNYQSKNFLKQAVQDLMLYSETSKRNPLLELSSFKNLVLLAGDAGTGKTYTAYYAISEAKKIAQKYNKNFQAVKLEIESSYQDGAILMLRNQLQEISSSNKNYIVFLDDCEKYFPERSQTRLDHKKDIVTEFLHFTQGVNGYKNRGNYLLIATANIPQSLDKALLSRFGDSVYHCEGPVTAEEKANVLKNNLKIGIEQGFVQINNWNSIGNYAFTMNLQGRDLHNIAKSVLMKSRSTMNYEEAYRNANNPEKMKEIILQSYQTITERDIFESIDRIAEKNIVVEKAGASYAKSA